MSTLRSRLIHLAHENSELRPHLLPLLKEAAKEKWPRAMAEAERDRQRGVMTGGEYSDLVKEVQNAKSESDAFSIISKYRRMRTAMAAPHTFKVGTILVSMWGYDQTNIDFYEVIAVPSPKSVVIRQLHKTVLNPATRLRDGTEKVMPVLGSYRGPPMRKVPGSGGVVKIDSFSSAVEWEGEPEHQTPAELGH